MTTSDIRLTPASFLAHVRAFAGGTIALDVCTQPENPTGAASFYTEDDDGKKRPWSMALRQMPLLSAEYMIAVAWANPPYSRGQVIEWARKAAAEARRGADILFLTKDDCRPKWNRFLLHNADARCRLDKGIGFLEPDGDGGYTQLVGPKWGSTLWMFGRHRRRFARVFGALGEVTWLMGPQEDES